MDEDPVLQARDKRIGELEQQVAILTAERDRLAGNTQSQNRENAATDQQTRMMDIKPLLNIMEADLPYYYDWDIPWVDQCPHDANKQRRLLIVTIDELAQFEANLGTLQLEGDFGNRVRNTLNTWRIMINQGFAYLCSLEANHIECRYALTYRANHPLSAECRGKDPRKWRNWLAKPAEEKELKSASKAEMEKDTGCQNAAEDGGSGTDTAIGTGPADPGEGETVSKEDASENSTSITPDGRDDERQTTQPGTSEIVSGFTMADLDGETAPAASTPGSTAMQQAFAAPSEPSSDGPQVTDGVEVRIPPPQVTGTLGTAVASENTSGSSTATSESVADDLITIPESSSPAQGRASGRGRGRGRGRGSTRGGRRAR